MKKRHIKAMALPGILDQVLLMHRSKAKEEIKPYREQSDEELIALVQKGEVDAFAYVLERYQGKIYSYIMRLMNHRDEAHDITQDVFLKAYKHLHRFDTERKFSSWIYRIAHNESVNWLKKKTRVKMESIEVRMEIGRELSSNEDIHEELERKQDQEMVREAISALPGKYQEVMDLRYLQQHSYHEISQKLKKPINTIGTLINRAKKRLHRDLPSP